MEIIMSTDMEILIETNTKTKFERNKLKII